MKKRTTITFGHAGALALEAFGKNASAIMERCLLDRYRRCRLAIRPMLRPGVLPEKKLAMAEVVRRVASFSAPEFSTDEIKERLHEEVNEACEATSKMAGWHAFASIDDVFLIAEEYQLGNLMVRKAVDSCAIEAIPQSREKIIPES